ncbi:hypothetical protein GJ699_33380 [Duganella sp. FT80W]|uniref:histidine kinase n=1 Tax=Duganella guangzhouensis TaxID=2666084 RepID=A0A6I2LF56_9BURK|nr:HAMP domain-containing sensor histidine kinase [Duganella guangzhouensis]MRW94859.1 hypothetical protein [Duganella guangzhouensis]
MDTLTASTALSIVQLCISATMIGLYYAAPSERYTRLWAASGVLTSAGMTIIFLNISSKPGFMLTSGNSMLFAGCVVVWIGLRAFYEQKITFWAYSPIPIFSGLYSLLVSTDADFSSRAALSSISLIFVFFLCMHSLLKIPENLGLSRRGYARGMAILGLVLLSSAHIFRIILIVYWNNPSESEKLMQFNAISVYLVALAGTVLFFPALLLLYFERIKHQLIFSLNSKQEALDIQNRFVEMFSHEYRTPLAVIRTNLAILKNRDEASGERLKGNLEKMQRAVQRLVEVAETALESGKIADVHMGIYFDRVQLSDFLTAVISESIDYWGISQVQIELHIYSSSILHCDVKLLKTALLNLIDNAIKYGPQKGAVDITARLEVGATVITVADRGPGIPEQELELVYRKYFRGSRTGSVAGSGVGLYLVRRIIGQHGGSITLTNRAGGGTLATIILPCPPKVNNDNGISN